MPARSLETRPPVPLRSPANFGNGLTARVVASDAVTSTGAGPGQISGQPAVALTIVMQNRSPEAVTLDSVVVSTSYGPASVPGLPVDGAPARPFSGSLPVGGSATAVYVFAIPPEGRGAVSVSLSYSVDAPVLVLSGSVG